MTLKSSLGKSVEDWQPINLLPGVQEVLKGKKKPAKKPAPKLPGKKKPKIKNPISGPCEQGQTATQTGCTPKEPTDKPKELKNPSPLGYAVEAWLKDSVGAVADTFVETAKHVLDTEELFNQLKQHLAETVGEEPTTAMLSSLLQNFADGWTMPAQEDDKVMPGSDAYDKVESWLQHNDYDTDDLEDMTDLGPDDLKKIAQETGLTQAQVNSVIADMQHELDEKEEENATLVKPGSVPWIMVVDWLKDNGYSAAKGNLDEVDTAEVGEELELEEEEVSSVIAQVQAGVKAKPSGVEQLTAAAIENWLREHDVSATEALQHEFRIKEMAEDLGVQPSTVLSVLGKLSKQETKKPEPADPPPGTIEFHIKTWLEENAIHLESILPAYDMGSKGAFEALRDYLKEKISHKIDDESVRTMLTEMEAEGKGKWGYSGEKPEKKKPITQEYALANNQVLDWLALNDYGALPGGGFSYALENNVHEISDKLEIDSALIREVLQDLSAKQQANQPISKINPFKDTSVPKTGKVCQVGQTAAETGCTPQDASDRQKVLDWLEAHNIKLEDLPFVDVVEISSKIADDMDMFEFVNPDSPVKNANKVRSVLEDLLNPTNPVSTLSAEAVMDWLNKHGVGAMTAWADNREQEIADDLGYKPAQVNSILVGLGDYTPGKPSGGLEPNTQNDFKQAILNWIEDRHLSVSTVANLASSVFAGTMESGTVNSLLAFVNGLNMAKVSLEGLKEMLSIYAADEIGVGKPTAGEEARKWLQEYSLTAKDALKDYNLIQALLIHLDGLGHTKLQYEDVKALLEGQDIQDRKRKQSTPMTVSAITIPDEILHREPGAPKPGSRENHEALQKYMDDMMPAMEKLMQQATETRPAQNWQELRPELQKKAEQDYIASGADYEAQMEAKKWDKEQIDKIVDELKNSKEYLRGIFVALITEDNYLPVDEARAAFNENLNLPWDGYEPLGDVELPGDLSAAEKWTVFNRRVKYDMGEVARQRLYGESMGAERQQAHDKIEEEAKKTFQDKWALMDDAEKFNEASMLGVASDPYQVTSKLEEPKRWSPIRAEGDSNNRRRENYEATRKALLYLQKTRTAELLAERGYDTNPDDHNSPNDPEEVARAVWADWKADSGKDYGLMMQLAAAEEMGTLFRMPNQKMLDRVKSMLKRLKNFGPDTKEVIKAHVRATWEASQYALRKAGLDTLDVYRGLPLPRSLVHDLDKEEVRVDNDRRYKKLPSLQLQRNGAASTTSKRSVANDWDGVGQDVPSDASRVVLRIKVPATSVLSLPAYGQNIAEEEETVILGGHWFGWDAWHEHAPSVEDHAIDVAPMPPVKEAEKPKAEKLGPHGETPAAIENVAISHSPALKKVGGKTAQQVHESYVNKPAKLTEHDPTWVIPPGEEYSVGGVIVNGHGQVLLRKPTGGFQGLSWTFHKGTPEPGQHPTETAVVEMGQETGHKGQIIGTVPGVHTSATWRNVYYLMQSTGFDHDLMDWETEATRWATPEEARKLIAEGANKKGVKRDLGILEAALEALDKLKKTK